jgi:hypothetical protein
VDQTLGAVVGDYHLWDHGEKIGDVHDQHDLEVRLWAGKVEDTAKRPS